MIVFMDGFDQLSGQTEKLAEILVASGYETTGIIAMHEGRNVAQQSLAIGNGTTGAGTLKRTIVNAQQKLTFGFAYKATAKRGDIVQIPGLGTLAWNEATGRMSMAGATGTAIVLLNLWYYIEISVDKTAKTVTVHINNGQDFQAVLPSTAEFLSIWPLTWSTTGDLKLIDDFLVVDSATGANVTYASRLGPIQITSRLPSVDVDKEWTPSTGTEHWPLVDNMPPKDDEFIQSNTSGATDTFLSNTPIPDQNNILAVGMTVLNRKSDLDARQLGMVMGQKGQTQIEKVDTALSVAPKYSYAVFEKAPGGAAWNADSVTANAFGVIVRP